MGKLSFSNFSKVTELMCLRQSSNLGLTPYLVLFPLSLQAPTEASRDLHPSPPSYSTPLLSTSVFPLFFHIILPNIIFHLELAYLSLGRVFLLLLPELKCYVSPLPHLPARC